MATTLATLTQQVRRFLNDWPEGDALTAAVVSASATTLTVADATIYSPNWIIQVDQEAMRVVSGASTTLTVRRGAQGTSPVTHLIGATILLKPAFLDQQIIDSVNAGINATFPQLYKQVIDTSLTADGATYEFTVPFMPSSTTVRIPRVSHIELLTTGDTAYRKVKDWEIRRGATPKFKFRQPPPGGTLRVVGYGPFPNLAATSDSLDALWPAWSEDLLVEYAAQRLLASGEAQRVRQDTGARDDREAATRPGSAMAAANAILQRFQIRLRDAAMPPLPPHCVYTF